MSSTVNTDKTFAARTEADNIGLFLQDYGEDLYMEPASLGHVTITTPDFLGIGACQWINNVELMNLGANILNGVCYCYSNKAYPEIEKGVQDRINRRLGGFYNSKIKGVGYDAAMHKYGLAIGTGDAFVVAVTRRNNMLAIQGKMAKDLEIGNEDAGFLMIRSYIALVHDAIESRKNIVPPYTC